MRVNQLTLYQTKKAIDLPIAFLCSKYFIVRDVFVLLMTTFLLSRTAAGVSQALSEYLLSE